MTKERLLCQRNLFSVNQVISSSLNIKPQKALSSGDTYSFILHKYMKFWVDVCDIQP